MLVYAAIIPPSPLLLPRIGTVPALTTRATHDAIYTLKSNLACCHADVLVIISQYAVRTPRFCVGINEAYRGTLQSFGDLEPCTAKGAPLLAHQLLAALPHGMASAYTQPLLDHGSIVACRLLNTGTPLPLIPLHISVAPYASQARVGALLSDALMQCKERVAVVVTGDLSQHTSDTSPEGYRPEGILFDHAVIAAFKKNPIKHLLEAAHKYEDESSLSALREFLVLAGILHEFNARFNLLSYEAPFGIGYLTAEYVI